MLTSIQVLVREAGTIVPEFQHNPTHQAVSPLNDYQLIGEEWGISSWSASDKNYPSAG